MTPPEFSRPVRVETLGPEPRRFEVEANEAERAALARRFDLQDISRLAAEMTLMRRDADVVAKGELSAAATQSCVATGEAVPASVETSFELVFRPPPEGTGGEEEVELSSSELDVVFYDGASIDIGEAMAETLALSLDPYPRAPDSEEALKHAGVKSEEEAGPFAALAALRDKLKK